MFENKLKDLMRQIHKVINNPTADNTLPSNSYYLKNGDVLCCPRKNGVSRFPYSADGLNMWAYTTPLRSISVIMYIMIKKMLLQYM